MTDYVTKDSGEKSEYDDGMRRDKADGKPQFTLMFPKGVPYEEQLMTRVAALYHRGGVKYGPRNWEKSCTEESLAHHEDSLLRHVVAFLVGVDDGEDHAAAIVWNVNAVDLTRHNITKAAEDAKKPVNAIELDPRPLPSSNRYHGTDCPGHPPDACCPAHGNAACKKCCAAPYTDCTGCGYVASTGMHWDTCANRKKR